MNTRSFFKSLALMAAGAAVAPGIFIPKFEPVRWKSNRFNEEQLARMWKQLKPNPAWVDACGEEDWSCLIVSPGFYAAYSESENLSDPPKFPTLASSSLPKPETFKFDEQTKLFVLV